MQQRGFAASRDASPMVRCLGAGGCPSTLPATGWYRTRLPQGRMHGQTLAPGFLLGHCLVASRGQLEHFGGRGSDQASWPRYHCPAWALKPPRTEGGQRQSPGAGGGRRGAEGWGAMCERVGWGVPCGTLPRDAGGVCLLSSSLFVPSLPQHKLTLAGQWLSCRCNCCLILGCLAPLWLPTGNIRARHWARCGG